MTENALPHALVVDDYEDIAHMLAFTLQRTGWRVTVVLSGAAALQAANDETNKFDLIISDIGMPKMSGYELAQALRRIPRYSKTPMLAITGFAVYDDKRRSLDAGFNAHLTKPIESMTLCRQIERLMGEPKNPQRAVQ